VQGYGGRDHAYFAQYREQSRELADFEKWLGNWVLGVADRREYVDRLGACRVEALGVREHALSAPADFGY
jgi:glutaconate CoA-transferase subunit A